MALQDAAFDGDLWFFAFEDSNKITEIRANPEVNVTFADDRNSSWTSISGRAEVVQDRAKAEELHVAALRIWFPEGVDTPGMTLIKVHADSAQYWEGPSSIVGKIVGGIRALVTRSPEGPLRILKPSTCDSGTVFSRGDSAQPETASSDRVRGQGRD
ncbi:pyridoxamine 5'-phosphate oxidase family protein [Arthrobacter sp. SD76]|uniref:pyridoxamine 5'-phosphate oxidase family protein n=1 Tax=Arthrobacter sp. SD76 TaxID=3415007 RepID=UPI003C788A53